MCIRDSLKSAVNQVGRDFGKVVSNQIFQDSHSTPYRRTGTSSITKTSRRIKKTEFEKAMNFQLGHRPSTLINRLSGVYTVLKNEIDDAMSDNYLTSREFQTILNQLVAYNRKMEDVADILELNVEKNSEQIKQVNLLNKNIQTRFIDALKVGKSSSEQLSEEYYAESQSIEKPNLLKHLALSTIWMGKYSKTGKLRLVSTLIMNAITYSLPFLMGIPEERVMIYVSIYGLLFVVGFFTFSSLKSIVNDKRNQLLNLVDIEDKKIDIMNNIIKSNSA